MPYKSDSQRRLFNALRAKLESQGVDVSHWNKESKGLILPERISDSDGKPKEAAVFNSRLSSKLSAIKAGRELTVTKLLEAKRASDLAMYDRKREILRGLIAANPNAWAVDDPNSYHPGITHKPTNFRLHIDREIANMIPTVKRAGVLDNGLELIKHHLPRLRLDDSLIGASLGAGAGALSAAFSNAAEQEGKPRVSYLQRMLLGAGLGSVAGNVIGDRGRRYVINNLPAAGYGNSNHIQHLKPKSLSQVWQTLILDKPSDSVVSSSKLPGRLGEFNLSGSAATARYELFRRAAGLPIRDNRNAIFREIGRSNWSPTATSGGVPGHYRTIELNPETFESSRSDANVAKMLKRLEYVRKRPDREGDYPAFGDWLSRHGYTRNGKDITVEDLWDFELTPDENKQLKEYAGEFIRDPKQMNAVQDKYKQMTSQGWSSPWDPLWEGTDFVPNKRQHATELLKRKLINLLLLRDGGVLFKQRFSPKSVPVYADGVS